MIPPGRGQWVVQVFRRANSPLEVTRLKFGLDPSARYRLTDLDASTSTEAVGRELKEIGVQVSLTQKRSSALLTYQRLK